MVRMATRSCMAVRAMVRLMGLAVAPGFSSHTSSGTNSPSASTSRMEPRWQRICSVTSSITLSSSS